MNGKKRARGPHGPSLTPHPRSLEGRPAAALRTLLFALEQGRRPHEADVQEVAKALQRYDDFEVGSVGEAFGFPWNKHLSAKKAEKDACRIAWTVFLIQEDGRKKGKTIPLEGNRETQGALELAGERLGLKAAKVKLYRDAWLKVCKQTGIAPPGPREKIIPAPGYIEGLLSLGLTPLATQFSAPVKKTQEK